MRCRLLALLALTAWSGAAAAQTSFSITTVPAGASIEIDGEYVGLSPLVAPVEPGLHHVRATLDDHLPKERDVQIGEGQRADIQLRLEPATGIVSIEGLPLGARVLADGAPFEERSRLPPGPVVLTVEHEGSVTRASFTVSDEHETVVRYSPRAFDAGVLARGALIPGFVQVYEGHVFTGIALAAGVGSSALLASAQHRRAREADDDLETARRDYNRAESEEQVLSSRARVDQAYHTAVQSRYIRGAAIAAGVTFYVVSFVDAARTHSRRGGLQFIRMNRRDVALHATPTGLSLRLAL